MRGERQTSIAGYGETSIAAHGWRPRLVFALLLADFALFGLTLGVQGVLWARLLPALHVSEGAFGSAQLAAPLVAIVLLLLGGYLSAYLGLKRMAAAALALLAAAALALAASANLWGLVGALLLLGAGNGLFETALNGAALDWERATGGSVLNLLHAGFSAGAIAGALGAGQLLAGGRSPGQILVLLALLTGLLLVAALPVRYPPAEAQTAGATGVAATLRLLLQRRALRVLALVCALGAVGESAGYLWSAIYVSRQGGGALGSGLALGLLSGAMLAGRLVNARLVNRLGARVSLLLSGAGLALAALLFLLPGGVAPAIAAFAMLGLAVAGVVPTTLGAAARLAPGQSAAIAGGMLAALYLSFLICPPLIGWLATLTSLRTALLLVGVAGLAVIGLAHGIEPAANRPPGAAAV